MTADEATPMDESVLKGGGFIRQARTDRFLVRVKAPGGDLDAAQMHGLGDLAERFGDGTLHLTVRQGVEIRGVSLDDFNAFRDALAGIGLATGACGPRVRGVVTCPGSAVCKRGLAETKPLGVALDLEYSGMEGLPHKFKLAVTGCTASCAKPQENDVGFQAAVLPVLDEADGECIACGLCEAECPTGAITTDQDGRPIIDLALCDRDGACVRVCPTRAMGVAASEWKVFAGGMFGREPKLGVEIGRVGSDAEAVALAGRVATAFREHARGRERLRTVMDRVGHEAFMGDVMPGTGPEQKGEDDA